MEKIIINYFRLFLILMGLVFLEVFVLNKIDEYSYQSFKFISVSVLFALILSLIIERSSKLGSFIDIKGLYWIRSKKRYFVDWKNLNIQLNIDFKYVKLIKFNFDEKTSSSILLIWFTEQSITRLTKKNCPKDHAFYKVVKEYAKNRKIEF